MNLYGVCFGLNFKYGTRATVRHGAESPNELVDDFVFMFYIYESEGRFTLIDTGFRDKKMAADMGITLLSVEDEVSRIIGDKNTIDSVILTHSHWDHIGNLDLVPDADVYMAKETFELAMENATPEMKKRLRMDNVHRIDCEDRLLGFFDFYTIGGHTPDSSVLYFKHNNRKYVITGDECYRCDNLLKDEPIGICTDFENNESFIHKEHKSNRIPLPFHDGSVMNRYPKVSDHIVKIF